MSEEIARFYYEERNLDGHFYPGVPLADVTDYQWDGLPQWKRNSVDADPMEIYEETAPEPEE